MRNSLAVVVRAKSARRFAILVGLLCAALSLPLLSGAKTATTSITVVNNSNREIVHLYLSPVDQNNWGADQLNGSAIQSGGSQTLSDVSCNGPSIKVIGEDQNGCFVYKVVSCDGSAVWTITNDATPDCGN